MRVLFSASPGIGHIFPTVSTAWALRAAGHEVLLATGGYHDATAKAGLPVVDTAPGVDFQAVFEQFIAEHGTSFEHIRRPPEEGRKFATELFAVVSGKFVDHTVALARQWRPELIVHTTLQGAGPLAAAVIGVPAVAHTIGIGHTAELWDGIATRMAEHYQRFGIEPIPAAAVLDVSPPSMRPDNAEGWSMRYVPYNGGGVLEPWLFGQRNRPRITVTLGSVVPTMAGVGRLRPFVAAAGQVDAEFVLALGGVDTADLGEVPANVRTVDWTPLNVLLRASDAVIHHGGAGTMLTALDAGLPQLVLPHGADQFSNADAVAKAGAGAVVETVDLDVDRLASLLSDTAMRVAAAGIAAEMAGQPTPADLVPQLVALS